jgi:O-antigen ligase
VTDPAGSPTVTDTLAPTSPPASTTTPAVDPDPGGILGKWWFAICALTLIVASDYKFRARDPHATLGGSIDAYIVLELSLYGLVALYLISNHLRPVRVHRTQANIYFACLYIGLMVLSITYTPYPLYAIVRAWEMCVLLGLVLVAARVATRADMHRFAHAFLGLITVSALYGIAVPSPPVTNQQVGRFTWLAIHPAQSGVLAALGLLLAVSYVVSAREARPNRIWPGWCYGVALVICGYATLATQTRGAVAGAALGIIVIIVSMRGGRALVEVQVVLVVVILFFGLAFGNQIVTYFQRGETSQQLASLNARTNLWETAAKAVEKKPMFGYGVTAARGIFFDETGLGGGHNAVVTVVVELGFVGLIVWALLLITLVSGIRRLPIGRFPALRFDRALLLGVLTLLLVDAVFYDGTTSTANASATWLFITVAWLAVCRRTAAEGDPEPAETPAVHRADPPLNPAPLSIEEALQTAKIGRSSSESQDETSGRHGIYSGSIRPPARGTHPDDPGGGSPR